MGLNRNNLVLNLPVPGPRSVGTKNGRATSEISDEQNSGRREKERAGDPQPFACTLFRSSTLTESLEQTKFEYTIR